MNLCTAILVMALLPNSAGTNDEALHAEARRLSSEFLIVDTHIDVPYRMLEKAADISKSTEDGDFDYPRARTGGLDAVFMSIFTPWQREAAGTSKSLADSLIDMVEGFAVGAPSKFGIATTVSETQDLFKQDKIALLFGMENGSPIEGKLENVKYFYDRGVRYITLTHSKDNHICDSSYDGTGTWGGLSPFGRQVVAEMNRIGIMIDVSHISDKTFYQVMELSKAPCVASHSSCRHFTPGFERNMNDDMIRLLARNGGVIQINFGSTFISGECMRRYYAGKDASEEWAKKNGIDVGDKRVREWRGEYFKEHPVGFADITDVIDHIQHVVELVGADHVGLGSDFDGVGDSLPVGLKDVSFYPDIIYHLLKRGYSREAIQKICGGNLLRVMASIEHAAADAFR